MPTTRAAGCRRKRCRPTDEVVYSRVLETYAPIEPHNPLSRRLSHRRRSGDRCPVLRCAARGQQTFELNEQTFNQWLFNASQGTFDPDSELTLTLEAVDRVCGLSDPQKEKLRLAGRGDFARFEQQVDELRAKYVGKTYEQNEIGEIYQKIQPLGADLPGRACWASRRCSPKCLLRSLTPEQARKFDAIEAERRQARYAAKVRLFVAVMERSCPLTDKQRTAGRAARGGNQAAQAVRPIRLVRRSCIRPARFPTRSTSKLSTRRKCGSSSKCCSKGRAWSIFCGSRRYWQMNKRNDACECH